MSFFILLVCNYTFSSTFSRILLKILAIISVSFRRKPYLILTSTGIGRKTLVEKTVKFLQVRQLIYFCLIFFDQISFCRKRLVEKSGRIYSSSIVFYFRLSFLDQVSFGRKRLISTRNGRKRDIFDHFLAVEKWRLSVVYILNKHKRRRIMDILKATFNI